MAFLQKKCFRIFMGLGLESVQGLRPLHTRVAHPLCNRRDSYGVEEGHGQKNEVRKEKWIRKRNRPTYGKQWRIQNNYELQPLVKGTLASQSEWTDVETGHPGPGTDEQRIRRARMTLLAAEIHQAAMLVQRAKSMPTADTSKDNS